MTVKEFVNTQAAYAENPVKFNVVRPNMNGATEKLTIKNHDTFASMEILQWTANMCDHCITLFVG